MFSLKKQQFWTEKENENVDIEYENENEVMETDEISHETANDIVNQSLEILECPPLKVLWSDRTLSIEERSRMLQKSLKMLYPQCFQSLN